MKSKLKCILLLLITCAIAFILVACRNEETESKIPDDASQAVTDADDDSEPTEGATQAPHVPGEAITISISELAADLREEFADRDRGINQPPMWNLPKDHVFTLDLEFELTSGVGTDEMFAVYTDFALTDQIWANTRVIWNDTDPDIPEGHSRIELSPGFSPAGSVSGSFFDLNTFEQLELPGGDGWRLHGTDENNTWGYFKHYYLVQRIDPRTGHDLPQPLITIFTLDTQLEAPHSEFFITEDGHGGFRWNEVEGADYYLIIHFEAEMTGHTIMNPIDKVTGTYWIHPEHEGDYGGTRMNWGFRQGWGEVNDNFSVIAVNNETHSAVGTIHDGEAIGAILPFSWDWAVYGLEAGGLEMGQLPDGKLEFFLPNLGLLTTHMSIEMINGSTVQRSVIYDFDNAELSDIKYRMITFESDYNVHIPFRLDGVALTGVMVADVNPETYRSELAVIRRQIEEAASRGGGSTAVTLTSQTGDAQDDELPVEEDTSREIMFFPNDTIYANSALSAFLARNMLVANSIVDLTHFPESADWEYLGDAFFEAIYQNPLIMHVIGARQIPGKNAIFIEYKEARDTILVQQEAIRQVIPGIVSDIIDDNMTDLEKSVAINRFLVDWAEYDWVALDNAELHDFITVDAEFNDSFTAYGILVNRVGVCSGYAAAYTLLAYEAGLQSIVVTGHLEGTLPHAWNRVNIEGQWQTVDVTNNANDLLPNVFLHLPDDVAGSVLVEDRLFVLDDFLQYYISTDGSSEYYYVNDRMFQLHQVSDMVNELAGEIEANGSVTLRTEHTLNDLEFAAIAEMVMQRLDINEIYAVHWLGVIWMAKSPG